MPVNVLVSLEILKSGNGWSDEELYEQASYNLQVRHALGLHDLCEEIFTLRTIYNFRKRVREYAEETGINLMQKVFEQLTDAQLEAIALETGWQRMDSTQVLSNLAKMSRLELMISVLQWVYERLDASDQERWGKRWEPYLEKRPHQVCYKVPTDEVEAHLVTIGQELAQLEAELAQKAADSEVLDLIQRVLEEQYERETDGTVGLLPADQVSADSLQSPHDHDATYRVKGGQEYRGGYVVNVSETADDENDFQMITDIQVESNQTDDAKLMEQSLDDQAERNIEIDKVTTDGGYTGPTGEEACERHEVELRATRMRGGKSSSEKWGWEEYDWEMDEEGNPAHVSCPQGFQVPVKPGRTEGHFIARFSQDEQCDNCPFFQNECRVQERVRVGPTLYFHRRTVEVARRRQQLHPEDTPLRVLAESTVRSLKRAFPGSKLPVRGLIRARMMLYMAAVMVNLRRLHQHLSEKADETDQNMAIILSLLKKYLGHGLNSLFRHILDTRPIFRLQPILRPSR